jgi:hypothetical protein
MADMAVEEINKLPVVQRLSMLSAYMDYLTEAAAESIHKVFLEDGGKHEVAVIIASQIRGGVVLLAQTSCKKEALDRLLESMPTALEEFKKTYEETGREQNAPSTGTLQ